MFTRAKKCPARASPGRPGLALPGLGRPGPAIAGLASPGQKTGLAQHGLCRPGPAKAGQLQFFLAIHWPGPAQGGPGQSWAG